MQRLRDDLIERRISSGAELLEANRDALESLDPAEPGGGMLLGYAAQWVDIGFAGPELIKCAVSRVPAHARPHLRMLDYVNLRLAEGMVAMSEEEFDAAIRNFEFIGTLGSELPDPLVLAISKFWIGRCLRAEGRYDDALSYTMAARDTAVQAGFEKTAAVIRVLESWLMFQKGRLGEAARVLQESEAALAGTDDYVTLGNIRSAHGRIARREGKYERALQDFERAIEFYRLRDSHHRNLARSLVNISFVKRLLAVQLQKKLDRNSARRKSHGARPGDLHPAQDRSQIERMRQEAFCELADALEIYTERRNHHGMGAAHINRGLLLLDSGELDGAASESAEAFDLGEEKHDYILMARARILQCMVENAKFEEQIEEHPDPNRHAQLADEYARDAVEFARHTQNARLLARALIWQGLTESNSFFENTETARQCCNAATALLDPNRREYVWEDLEQLRARVLETASIEPVLQEWSQGLVGKKTFQQITNEFARIVIPKVWEREGRKVSRVAQKLSVSPKKVRRILQDSGLLERRESH